MKGIIRAGGYGTRLYPSTRAVNKHFFPVYDKPAVYYPLSLLIMTGVTKILLVVFPKDRQAYFDLLGDGSSFGVSISYQIQSEPVGLPESLMECRDFIGSESIVVALGDNVFFGEHLRRDIQGAAERFQKGKEPPFSVRQLKTHGILVCLNMAVMAESVRLNTTPAIPKAITR